MSKLDELINKLCPDGVKFYKFIDIGKCTKGNQLNKELLLDDGLYPVINGGINPSGFWNEFNFSENMITISQGGASAGYVQWQNTKFWAGAHCFVLIDINENVNYRFLYHVIKFYERKLTECQYGAGIPALATKTINDLEIPVPPLEVQREIVRILDNFAELTAELTAELSLRKSQYNFYLNSLINNPNYPRKSIGEIARQIYRGSGIKRDQVLSEGIECVRYGEVYTSYDNQFTKCISHSSTDFVSSPKYFEHGDIIFAITGEKVEEISRSIVYLGNNKCLAGGDTVVLKHNMEPRFLCYALSTDESQRQKSEGKVKSKVVHSSVPSIKKILVPVPDYEEQKRIADLLDNFYKISGDLSFGLPAEIEGRKKQYEYYRDKLLTFKELI